MSKKAKIIAVILAVVVVAGAGLYLSGGDLMGRMVLTTKPKPAYDDSTRRTESSEKNQENPREREPDNINEMVDPEKAEQEKFETPKELDPTPKLEEEPSPSKSEVSPEPEDEPEEESSPSEPAVNPRPKTESSENPPAEPEKESTPKSENPPAEPEEESLPSEPESTPEPENPPAEPEEEVSHSQGSGGYEPIENTFFDCSNGTELVFDSNNPYNSHSAAQDLDGYIKSGENNCKVKFEFTVKGKDSSPVKIFKALINKDDIYSNAAGFSGQALKSKGYGVAFASNANNFIMQTVVNTLGGTIKTEMSTGRYSIYRGQDLETAEVALDLEDDTISTECPVYAERIYGLGLDTNYEQLDSYIKNGDPCFLEIIGYDDDSLVGKLTYSVENPSETLYTDGKSEFEGNFGESTNFWALISPLLEYTAEIVDTAENYITEIEVEGTDFQLYKY